MISSATNALQQLTPIECIIKNANNKNCHYNRWLVSIKLSPEKLTQSEKDKVIDIHNILQKESIGSSSSEYSPLKFYWRILKELDDIANNIDFLDAFFMHMSEVTKKFEFSGSSFLGSILVESIYSEQPIAKALVQYLQIHNDACVSDEDKCTCIFYALANNNVELLNSLLVINSRPPLSVQRHQQFVKNFNYIDNFLNKYKDNEEVLASVINFMKKNIDKPYLQAEVFFNLYLNTPYLQKDKLLDKTIGAISENNDYRNMFAIISQLIDNLVYIQPVKTTQGIMSRLRVSNEFILSSDEKYLKLSDNQCRQILGSGNKLNITIPKNLRKVDTLFIGLWQILEAHKKIDY